ncbi:MAG: hypothetical protein IJZ24_01645 [Clostridia bacterium]|nr:hypothetical protein [Clostridia bacterium]
MVGSFRRIRIQCAQKQALIYNSTVFSICQEIFSSFLEFFEKSSKKLGAKKSGFLFVHVARATAARFFCLPIWGLKKDTVQKTAILFSLQ